MKRSDVLKIIEQLYNLELQMFPKENPSDIFAENLLCHLENLGMLPPIRGNKAAYNTVADEVDCTWEPEDGPGGERIFSEGKE